jgi:hypothetical protein
MYRSERRYAYTIRGTRDGKLFSRRVDFLAEPDRDQLARVARTMRLRGHIVVERIPTFRIVDQFEV